MIQIIYYLIFMLVLIYGLYFLLTSFGAFKKSKIIRHYMPKNKFGVIIAARNEEKVIGNLVKSLMKQNYDKDLFEVFVVVNNCTDNTLEKAKEAGATIIKCTEKVSTKGEVLKYTYKKLDKHDLDAYIIFDADNIVDKNFISRMNDAICDGYKVAQGYRDSKNIQDNWLSGSYSIFYYIQNFFFNRSRMNMNLSSSINGTGFMVKKEVIKEFGFEPVTLTEDIEFTAMCAINGVKIAFVDDALTYDEQPVTFIDSWKQRKRWSKGNLQCLQNYYKKLIKGAFTNNSIPCLDMLLVFMSPVIQVVAFLLLLCLILFRACGVELYDVFSYVFSYGISFFLITYLANVLLNAFIIKYNKRKITDTFFAILLFSFFIFTWIPINIVCLVKKNIGWTQIKHSRDISID